MHTYLVSGAFQGFRLIVTDLSVPAVLQNFAAGRYGASDEEKEVYNILELQVDNPETLLAYDYSHACGNVEVPSAIEGYEVPRTYD